MAWYGVITNAGKEVIENYLTSGVDFNINIAKTGTGAVERSQMTSMTDLVSFADNASVVGKVGTENGAKVEISIEASTTRYVMKEVGIFATLQDSSVVLIAYYNDVDGVGVEIPAVADFPDFNFTLYCLLDVINSEDLHITVDASAYVTMGNIVNNLTTPSDTEGFVLDARQGKVLDDKIAKTYPSNDGTTDQILRKSSGSGAYWGNAVTQSEVVEAVDDWLETNVPSGTTIAIDRSLSAQNAAAPADLVGDLKSALTNYSDGIDTFANYTDFKACGLFRGNNVASEKYRASSQSVLVFDKDINLTIADGFRIRLNTFVNGAFSSETNWYTGSYLIKKETAFKIVIAKVSEDTTSTANVHEFVNAITFNSYIGNSINKSESLFENVFDGKFIPVKFFGRFMRGTINDSGVVNANNTYNVCSTEILHTNREVRFKSLNESFRYIFYYYDANGNFLEKSTDRYRYTTVVPKNSYLRILITKVPEDTSLKANVDEFASNIGADSFLSGVVDQLSETELVSQMSLVKGTFENGLLNTTEAKRARTGFILSNGFSKLTVTPNNDYYWVVGGSDVIDNVLQNYYDVVPTWNHSEQEILLQPGIYVIIVANGATYSQSTDYDIANPSIRFEIQSLNYSETLKAITHLIGAKDELPSYWQTYMETKLPAIQTQVRESAMTGDSFVFLTDYHVEHNSGKSHLLIKDIIDHTPIHKVVFGGDIYNGSSTKEESIAKCQTFVDRFHGLPVFGIRGNHEYNLNDGGSANVKFTENDIYNFIVKPCEDKIRSSGKMYYYNDNEPQKIRYIFLDTKNITGTDPTEAAIDQEQLDWFVEQLQSLESDWNVVIFVHDFWARTNGVWNPSADGEAIENAISTSNTDATICAIICGHVHLDYSAERNGIQCIATTWDGYYASTGRNLGTTTELAFDVFTIDTNAKTIKASRVGYGEDRTWTYGN